MARRYNYWAIIASVFATVVIIIPQYVSAVQQSSITETVLLDPYESDNDETPNLANETIEWNVDTWDPLPAGIFVGGTIKESLLRLHEAATGADAHMELFTIIQPRREYVMGGVAEFWVRLPVHVDMDDMPEQVNVAIWESSLLTYPLIYSGTPWYSYASYRYDDQPWHPDWDVLAHEGAYRIAQTPLWSDFNTAHLNPTPDGGGPGTIDIWDVPGTPSFVLNERIYVHVYAPLLPGKSYIFGTQVYYASGQFMDLYISPSDLASDNLTDSHVCYSYWPAVDQLMSRDYPVPADLGYSFVFMTGLGGRAFGYEAFFMGSDLLDWDTYVRVDGDSVSGAFNFIMEYRATAIDTPLDWSLTIENDLGGAVAIDGVWWTGKRSENGYILASNPVNVTYLARHIGSYHYLQFHCTLSFASSLRAQFMTSVDESWPAASRAVGHARWNGDEYYYENMLSFMPWCTISIQNVSLNETDMYTEGSDGGGFWKDAEEWFNDHWLDIIGVELIILGGVTIITLGWTGVGAVFGVALIAAGIGLILYNNHILDGLISMLIDGLTWLGNWLWRVAGMVWDVLTWVVDQLIDYGGQILALLIYGLAVIIPVFIITMVTKLMSVFYKIAKGDLTGATAEGRSLLSTATLGRYGGG